MKKECVERVYITYSIMSVRNMYVTTLKAKGTDAPRCIAIVVRKDGKVRMTRQNKATARMIMAEEGFKRYGIVDDEPDVTLWNKDLEIMYEDMDGYPNRCIATYVCEPATKSHFRRKGDGARMSNVFAFKEITE